MKNIILVLLIGFGGISKAHGDETLRLVGNYENPSIYYGSCRGNDLKKYPPSFFGQPIYKNSALSISNNGNNTLVLSLNSPGHKPLELMLADKNIVSWTNSWDSQVHKVQFARHNSTTALLDFLLTNLNNGSYAGGFWFFQNKTDLSISLTIAMDNWCELSWRKK